MGRLKSRLVALAEWMARPSLLVRVAIGVGVFAVFLIGSVEYTSRPNFCTTCHYMQPFYDSWAESSHSDVTCTMCHFPPGIVGKIHGKLAGLEQLVSYVGRSYTRRKPWAEIDDASCLQSGCHSTRKLDGEVLFKNVLFDHNTHLGDLRRGKDLRCTSCHSQVVQGEHILVTETTCFLCHMKESDDVAFTSNEKLGNCTTCHNWNEAPEEVLETLRFDHSAVVEMDLDCSKCHASTIIGDGFVPEENCYNCHFEEDRLNRYDETALIHTTHISENKIECIQCHVPIQHRIDRLTPEAELECSACHTGTHDEQLLLFTGKPRAESPHEFSGEPNPMLEAGLECSSCHLYHEDLIGEAEVARAGPSSCESCHGAGYDRLLDLWKEGADRKLQDLTQKIERVERTVQASTSNAAGEAADRINDAKVARNIVDLGKPVHNMQFSDQLIGLGVERLNEALTLVEADFRLQASESTDLIPSECANCHTSVETVETQFNGSAFRHEIHVVDQEIACKTCHSNVSTHGELVITRQSCNACHHNPDRVEDLDNCASCHETQAALYAGTYLDSGSPDIMFEEDILCEDCHGSGEDIARPSPDVCVDCHDDEYAEMPAEWKSEIAESANELASIIAAAPAEKRGTEAFGNARILLNDIGPDGAGGVHNYELTLKLLKEFRAAIQHPSGL